MVLSKVSRANFLERDFQGVSKGGESATGFLRRAMINAISLNLSIIDISCPKF
jgi:hypothetical protein